MHGRPPATAPLFNAAALLLPLASALAGGCSASPVLNIQPASRPSITSGTREDADALDAWKQIAAALGKEGKLRDGVYTLSFPRDDLSVAIEGMVVPTAAGLASIFHFYRCSCGKTAVIGQFVLTDYEANDVAYALQKQDILISAMAPLLLYEKPRLMTVRFQAEGKPRELAGALAQALGWVGRNREAPPKPADISP